MNNNNMVDIKYGLDVRYGGQNTNRDRLVTLQ